MGWSNDQPLTGTPIYYQRLAHDISFPATGNSLALPITPGDVYNTSGNFPSGTGAQTNKWVAPVSGFYYAGMLIAAGSPPANPENSGFFLNISPPNPAYPNLGSQLPMEQGYYLNGTFYYNTLKVPTITTPGYAAAVFIQRFYLGAGQSIQLQWDWDTAAGQPFNSGTSITYLTDIVSIANN